MNTRSTKPISIRQEWGREAPTRTWPFPIEIQTTSMMQKETHPRSPASESAKLQECRRNLEYAMVIHGLVECRKALGVEYDDPEWARDHYRAHMNRYCLELIREGTRNANLES